MRFDHYSNVLQLAAALSMAGWVARSPGNNDNFPVNFNNQYSFEHNNRYHPYSQLQFNQQWDAQQQGGVFVEQAVAPQNNFFSGRNELYQSKDAEETFRAHMELQELISWQESYRRGDFPVGHNNQHYVMPVGSSPRNNLEKFPNPSLNDDGYSTGSSVGSPASSTISGVPSEVDNYSIGSSMSPVGSVFEGENQVQNVPFSQINNNVPSDTFDIDEILNLDGDDVKSPEFVAEDQKIPFANLLSYDDLGYANSPSALKNPGVDSFFGKRSPEYNPPHTMTNKYDDPFSMQFTNASGQEKFPSDTLVDLGYLDPSLFDQTDDEMLDKALVQSLSQKGNPPAVKVKEEDDWLSPGSPMVEHDYFNREDIKPPFSASNLINKRQPFQNVMRPTGSPTIRQRQLSTSSNRASRGRTFAPNHTNTVGNRHTQKSKEPKALLWSDFPYTSSELVEMPVERFHEVIQQLDEIRQHVAKDERRKGKNKLAARNCRKRKMDIIEDLDHGVAGLEKQRDALLEERKRIMDETRELKRKTEWLNNYIFEHMRDSNGLPYSENDFSLQFTSDGNVYLVPSVGNNRDIRN